MLAARRLVSSRLISAAFVAGSGVATARADNLGQWDGFDIRLDTAVRVSLGFRTEDANPSLLANINGDEGDRAFTPGLNSERVDVVSELAAERGRLGFDVSGQGWYDAAYNTRTADDSPQTYNPVNASYRSFTPDVRALMGRQAELLNAYVRDTADVADLPVTVSIGRQTLLWGESLLFPGNGVAAAQAPVDEIKSLGAPLAEARELFLPVTQVVVRVGLGDGLSIEGYDQVEWRRDRLPGVGSFFSTTDILDQGGQRLFGVDGALTRTRSGDDIPHGAGQFGVALRQVGGDVDWGLYALRADARSPVVILDTLSYTYHLDYPRGIGVYGASLSGYAGPANVAAEISVHQNTPLDAEPAMTIVPGYSNGGSYGTAFSLRTAFAGFLPPPAPVVARGTSLNGQTSLNTQWAPNRFFDGAFVQAELAGNELIGGAVPAGRTAFALAARTVLTLQYFRVEPGLDISVPVGAGMGLVGRSSTDASQNAGTGFLSVGLGAVYRVIWQGSLSFTHFIGGAGSQALADRDFATLSVTRTF